MKSELIKRANKISDKIREIAIEKGFEPQYVVAIERLADQMGIDINYIAEIEMDASFGKSITEKEAEEYIIKCENILNIA